MYEKEVGITAIAVIETSALLTGTDGAFLGLAIAAVAGIAGYAIGCKHCEGRKNECSTGE